MSHHRSQRGGGAAVGGGVPGSTSADGEVRVGLTDVILENGPEDPQYGRVLSQAASLRFFTLYAEYKRSMELSNNAQSISRPLLLVSQLLGKFIRSFLSRTYFDGTELQDDDLRETLATRTRSVGRVTILIRLLRRQRCAIV